MSCFWSGMGDLVRAADVYFKGRKACMIREESGFDYFVTVYLTAFGVVGLAYCFAFVLGPVLMFKDFVNFLEVKA